MLLLVPLDNHCGQGKVTMAKLLLALTLVAFLSGVLCNVAQNLAEGGPTADSVPPRTKVLGGHVEFYNRQNQCCAYRAPDDYVVSRGIGAHKLIKQPAVTWNDARLTCIREGGQLAIIQSDVEGLMLVDWLKRENIAEAWIGTHDMFQKGQWVTLTGVTLTAAGYEHWLPGEPTYADGNEHCGSLKYSGGMKSLACDHWRSYFCKIDLCY